MKTLVLALVLVGSLGASALQAQSRVDRLEAQLAGTSGLARLALLADLVEVHAPAQAVTYGREALALLADYPDDAIERRVHYYKGLAHRNADEPDSARVHVERLKQNGAAAWQADGALLEGWLVFDDRRYEAAQTLAEAALAGYETLGERTLSISALELLGHAHRWQNDKEGALAYYMRSLRLREELGDKRRIAQALVNIGLTHKDLGAYDEALSFYTRALTSYEELGDKPGMASTLNNIGNAYWYKEAYAEALSFHTRALVFKEELGDKQDIASSLNNIGAVYMEQGDYDQALSFFTRALPIYEEHGGMRGMAAIHTNMARIYRIRGDYAEALSPYTRALALYEELGDKRGIAGALNNIGRAHKDLGDYAEALLFFTRALSLREELGDKRGIASVLTSIGNVNWNLRVYDEALAFYTRALTRYEELGDKSGMASTLNNIGLIHKDLGDYAEALAFYTRALSLREELGNKRRMVVTLNNIGDVHQRQGRYDEALSFMTRSLALAEEFGEKKRVVQARLSIGTLYGEQGHLDEALLSTDQALALADSIGDLFEVRNAYRQRADLLERQGRFAEALTAHKAYKAAYDSLFTSESQSVVAELQQQYKTKEQQQQIELLENRRAQQRLFLILLLGGVGLLGVIILLQVGRMRLRRRAMAAIEQARQATEEKAAELERANALKSRFLANISHEFRTPLTLTFGPLDDIVNRHFASLDEALPHVKRARRNGGRLLRLINQLLDLSKLDAGVLLLRARRHDLACHLLQITALFDSMADVRGIHLTTKIPDKPCFHVYDADKIEKVVVNLLSNAFKFTPPGGKIAVVFDQEADGAARIEVADTGPGIAEDNLVHLFDRFYQVENATTRSHEGTGIGLALAKELVELHEGTIEVESTVGFGTRFTIRLPMLEVVEEEAIHEVEVALPDVASGDGASETIAAQALPAETIEEGGTVVLVVEDNADMRAYIRAHLEDQFTVVEAENGQVGVEQALDLVPDLVLSDVMMPVMDGLEVCAALKADERTSHIPVMLLTARAQVEHRIEGFESGADAYLPKPFNAKELQVRVRTLINERRRLRARFVGGMLDPDASSASAAASLPPREAAFLDKVEEVIDEHLSNGQFGVDQMATELLMSRRQLLRKLRALTDETPVVLLRQRRLDRAALMLRGGEMSVKEVCYAVGFQSNSSFTRAFRQAYGVSPYSYLDKIKNELS